MCVASGFAQILATANSPEYKNILKMSASLFTRSTFQMGYERFINPNTSFLLSAGMSFKDSDYEKVWGVRTEAQMKFHVFTVVKPQQSHRLYFAPYLLNEYYETEGTEYNYNGNSYWQTETFDAFGGGMLFGWSSHLLTGLTWTYTPVADCEKHLITITMRIITIMAFLIMPTVAYLQG